MNILSIAPLNGGKSHITPLFVLIQRYFSRMAGVKNVLLVQEMSITSKLFKRPRPDLIQHGGFRPGLQLLSPVCPMDTKERVFCYPYQKECGLQSDRGTSATPERER